MNITALSRAYENVTETDQNFPEPEHFLQESATTYGTSVASLTPAQTIFNFNQPTPTFSPALHEARFAANTPETSHAGLRQLPISPEQLLTQVAPILTPFSCEFTGLSLHATPPSALLSNTSSQSSSRATVSRDHHRSPTGDIDLCHDCDRFLRTFARYRYVPPVLCLPSHTCHYTSSNITRRTSIHLGSGTCANCHHLSPAASTGRLITPDAPGSQAPARSRTRTASTATSTSLPRPYFCTYLSCPRSEEGQGFTRKDNRNVHIRTVHRTAHASSPPTIFP